MDIIKTNNFYYLTHSFRKKGRVVNRKKYIGKEIPLKIEELKQQFLEHCFKEDVFIKLNRIKKNYTKEWKTLPESIKKKRMIQFSINLTYNSNAIEGSTITEEETENLIVRNLAPQKPLSDVQETINHSKVFFKVIQEKNEFSETTLLSWHKELFGQTKEDIAGIYREYLVRVGSYRAPDWQDVPKLMKGYFSWYHKNKKIIHPVELAAIMHYEFEKIHPFGDGNGRLGRLLMNYILYNNYFPMLSIDVKKRKYYYHGLERGRVAFIQYFIRLYVTKYKEDM
ncbi:MAG: Fic family protein [Nanoarchaeota archaeon]